MKKWLIMMFVLGIVTLAACGNNQEEEIAQDQAYTPDPTPIAYTDETTEDRPFNFTRFELDVDYVDSLSYDVEYVHNENQVKASINELDRQKVTGKEAFNQLAPHFLEMSFDEDTPEDDVIKEVLDILGLDETFKEFELEVTYQNGMEMEYER